MKRQGGFTLIELVVVIVILGILAVTAAPKFLNLQSDARASSLQGLKGAMGGAAGIVYGKAAIDGNEATGNPGALPATASAAGVTISFGYPVAASGGINVAVVGLNDDWSVISGGKTTDNSVTYGFKSGSKDSCSVTYTEAADKDTPPVITAAGVDAC